MTDFPEALTLSDQLRADLDRRLAQLEEHPEATFDWEEVKVRIRAGDWRSG